MVSVENLCLDCFLTFTNAVADVKGGCIIGLCWENLELQNLKKMCVCVCVFGRLLGALNLFL